MNSISEQHCLLFPCYIGHIRYTVYQSIDGFAHQGFHGTAVAILGDLVHNFANLWCLTVYSVATLKAKKEVIKEKVSCQAEVVDHASTF